LYGFLENRDGETFSIRISGVAQYKPENQKNARDQADEKKVSGRFFIDMP
jgi:hypothetical protein